MSDKFILSVFFVLFLLALAISPCPPRVEKIGLLEQDKYADEWTARLVVRREAEHFADTLPVSAEDVAAVQVANTFTAPGCTEGEAVCLLRGWLLQIEPNPNTKAGSFLLKCAAAYGINEDRDD